MTERKILLVEDNEAQAKSTSETLQKSGYVVLRVSDGISAIKAIMSDPPDVVLLDLQLPGMSGTEVCRWIKLNNETKGIPVIMLTAMASLDNMVAGIRAGADDYLPKPYDDIELNAKIYAALRTKALQDELRQKNTQLTELLAKVEAMASTDPLTGLFNRRHFESILDAEWKKSERYRHPITCLLADIDFFKSVNDTYGHKTGDLVLIEIAKTIKNTVRDVDTAARWGGEEFIAVLPYTNRDNGLIAAQRILEKVSACRCELLPEHRITVSIGLAASGPNIKSKDRLIDAADKALYEAKRKGRNRIECFTYE